MSHWGSIKSACDNGADEGRQGKSKSAIRKHSTATLCAVGAFFKCACSLFRAVCSLSLISRCWEWLPCPALPCPDLTRCSLSCRALPCPAGGSPTPCTPSLLLCYSFATPMLLLRYSYATPTLLLRYSSAHLPHVLLGG